MTVVLVTGGAKRIGKSIAEQCAAKGHNVAIHYNTSEPEALDLVQALSDCYPNQIIKSFKADLNDIDSLPRLMSAVVNQFGYCDVLINNASTFEYDTLSSVEPESWDFHNNVNAKAPLFLAKAFVNELRSLNAQVHTGNIINIIDQRVWNLTSHFLTYSVSKVALWAVTQILALELAPLIRVNAIGPGPTLPNVNQTQKQFDDSVAQIPLKTPTALYDFGNTIEFILNTNSLTGQMIALDGGQHMGWGFPNTDVPRYAG
ncbi:MAG: SDR family oxidoreductase [Alphaproteobacteria bacterium]|nr:SDR family oxidoreductase [Alphaproteobacteria bacterium]MDP5012601.1 SDR family oxidoreductase [Alphaproteobacteria bacterium]